MNDGQCLRLTCEKWLEGVALDPDPVSERPPISSPASSHSPMFNPCSIIDTRGLYHYNPVFTGHPKPLESLELTERYHPFNPPKTPDELRKDSLMEDERSSGPPGGRPSSTTRVYIGNLPPNGTLEPAPSDGFLILSWCEVDLEPYH